MTVKHAPTPWDLEEECYSNCEMPYVEFSIHTPKGYILCKDTPLYDSRTETLRKNLEHIVRCVNEYDKLKAKADLFDETVKLIEWVMYKSDKGCSDKNISKAGEMLDLLQKAKELNNENN